MRVYSGSVNYARHFPDISSMFGSLSYVIALQKLAQLLLRCGLCYALCGLLKFTDLLGEFCRPCRLGNFRRFCRLLAVLGLRSQSKRHDGRHHVEGKLPLSLVCVRLLNDIILDRLRVSTGCRIAVPIPHAVSTG